MAVECACPRCDENRRNCRNIKRILDSMDPAYSRTAHGAEARAVFEELALKFQVEMLTHNQHVARRVRP